MSNKLPQKRKVSGTGSIEDEFDKSAKKSKKACCFCLSSEDDPLQFGELLSKSNVTCHYFCLLLASGLFQNGRAKDKNTIKGFLLSDIQKEVKRGLRLKCFWCHSKGATIGCCQKGCRKAFHLPCGRANGSLHQFFGGFGSFCDEHGPKQLCKSQYQHKNHGPVSCSICLNTINTRLTAADILHSPCCNNASFHSRCLQQYAISAGKHHFRCPMCNCRKTFLEEMQSFGIYIPDQDASWERQSGAFEELLERHSTCDADVCSCPQGRNHDAESGKYDLLLCASCGSFGSHRACRGLVWSNSLLVCQFCVISPKEYEEMKLKTSMSSPGAKTSKSGGSGPRPFISQLNSGAATMVSATAAEEKVIHLEMEDSADYVDVESDSDNVDIPPFFAKGLSRKELLFKYSVNSCCVVLERIDKKIPLSGRCVNLKQIPGFSYNKQTGQLSKKGGTCRKKSGSADNQSLTNRRKKAGSGKVKKLPQAGGAGPVCGAKSIVRQPRWQQKKKLKSGNQDKITESGNKGGGDRKDSVLSTPKSFSKKEKVTNRTSPLSMKKLKVLNFILKFNQTAELKRRRSKKKNSPIRRGDNKGKVLIQCTLNFNKGDSPNSKDVPEPVGVAATVCVEASPEKNENDERLAACGSLSEVVTQNVCANDSETPQVTCGSAEEQVTNILSDSTNKSSPRTFSFSRLKEMRFLDKYFLQC